MQDVAARPPFTLPRAPAALRALLEENGLVVAVLAVCAALLAAVLPAMFVSDSWLALVDGRLVAHHGLPHVDTLARWTLGRRWVDQQWGAQLVLYGAFRAAGLRAVAGLTLGCVVAALAVASYAARRLGASARSAAFAPLVALLAAPTMAQARPQTLTLPLFVVVFALLAADSRRPSRRVLLAVPLLVVWANLHGSVALAAALVSLYGLTLLRPRATRLRGAALAGAPLALVASPYGFALVGYYRTMLLDPPFAHVVSEWRPLAVGVPTSVFICAALVFAALWGRCRSALTPFERWATVALLAAALDAQRNATWFALSLAVVLPRLVDEVRPAVAPARALRRVNAWAAGAAIVVALAVAATHLGRPAAWFDRAGTPAQAAAVAAAAGHHGIVLADDRHADWLLWQRPDLAGRVAYDARFELLDRSQLAQVVALDRLRPRAWATCGATAEVVTFGTPRAARLLRPLVRHGARLLFDGRPFGAYVQAPAAGRCAA